MTALDSRSLTYVDCFGLKFPKPGTFRYDVSTAAGAGLHDEARFSVDVREGSGKGENQHDVQIRLEGRELIADPPQVVIDVGDVVLWNTTESGIPGIVIAGEGDTNFDSRRLRDQAIYTHAFGQPGEYVWRDAWSGEIGGTVDVRSPDAEPDDRESAARWMKSLSQGTLIHVKGREVNPERVEIVTGQTVFWAIEQSPGISITDADLL
jgi:plastocyanin